MELDPAQMPLIDGKDFKDVTADNPRFTYHLRKAKFFKWTAHAIALASLSGVCYGLYLLHPVAALILGSGYVFHLCGRFAAIQDRTQGFLEFKKFNYLKTESEVEINPHNKGGYV